MTIQTLIPHMSCVCGAEDLAQAQSEGYKEIYILTTKGILKHHIFRGTNRYIRLKVDTIPGYTEPEIKEAFNFLPAGRIPYTIFEQIEAFFRKVIQLKGTALEAMIFIMWNPTDGYFLYVPTQSVGAASVSFDPSTMPSGSSVIVNVHSHGHMSAFFSGTDDNNDKDLIQFSGVFGNFQQPVPTTVWRFNYYTKKLKADVSDIFEPAIKDEIAVPQDWLDKVAQVAPAQIGYYGNRTNTGGHSNRGNVGPNNSEPGKSWDHLSDYHAKHSRNTSQTYKNRKLVNASEEKNWTGPLADEILLQSTFFGHEGDLHEEANQVITEASRAASIQRQAARASRLDAAIENGEFQEVFMNGYVPNADDVDLLVTNGNGKWTYDPKHPLVGISGQDEINASADANLARALGEADETPLGKSQLQYQQQARQERSGNVFGLSQEEIEELTDPVGAQPFIEGTDSGLYELIAFNHGPDVADAWHDIDQAMSVLNGKDELLAGLMSDMFCIISEDGQGKVFRDLYHSLSHREQERIGSNGL
jgi:PRTRC genetic system protein A